MRKMLFPRFLDGRPAFGLLVLRLVVGLAFAFHGLPKIEHATTWMTAAFGPAAFLPPFMQAVVAVVEFAGGIALVAGAFTTIAAALIAIDMAGVIFTVSLPHGSTFVGQHSYELELSYFAATLMLVLAGPGTIALDRVLAGGNRRGAVL